MKFYMQRHIEAQLFNSIRSISSNFRSFQAAHNIFTKRQLMPDCQSDLCSNFNALRYEQTRLKLSLDLHRDIKKSTEK